MLLRLLPFLTLLGCDGPAGGDTAPCADPVPWHEDADGDGFGDPASFLGSCDAPAGYVADATDCDDTLATVFPGATELCNRLDDDCDGVTDPTSSVDALTWYADADGDTFGNAATTTASCSQPPGYSADNTDCDDSNAAMNPAAVELCNGVDDDCDGDTDPPSASDALTWYADADGDTYGDAATAAPSCEPPAGHGTDAGDCNDTDPAISPAAAEVCDGVDNDCDGTLDDPSCTCLVDFERAYRADGSGADPTLYYGAYGLTFTMSAGYGLIGGDTFGDPGNWSEAGSIPDPAWGHWDEGWDVNTLSFASPVTNVAFDLQRTVLGDVKVSVTSYLSGAEVESMSVSLTTGSRVQTVYLSGTIDTIHTTITGGEWGFSTDNFEYTAPSMACPP